MAFPPEGTRDVGTSLLIVRGIEKRDIFLKVKTLRGDSIKPIANQHNAKCVPHLTSNLTETPPTCGMQDAAFVIIDTYATLFPKIKLN